MLHIRRDGVSLSKEAAGMARSVHLEGHRTERIGWLRAAVLGANDGIVSTASLMVGVCCRHADHQTGRRDDAVVGTKDGRAQPADPFGAVSFQMNATSHARRLLRKTYSVAPDVEHA